MDIGESGIQPSNQKTTQPQSSYSNEIYNILMSWTRGENETKRRVLYALLNNSETAKDRHRELYRQSLLVRCMKGLVKNVMRVQRERDSILYMKILKVMGCFEKWKMVAARSRKVEEMRSRIHQRIFQEHFDYWKEAVHDQRVDEEFTMRSNIFRKIVLLRKVMRLWRYECKAKEKIMWVSRRNAYKKLMKGLKINMVRNRYIDTMMMVKHAVKVQRRVLLEWKKQVLSRMRVVQLNKTVDEYRSSKMMQWSMEGLKWNRSIYRSMKVLREREEGMRKKQSLIHWIHLLRFNSVVRSSNSMKKRKGLLALVKFIRNSKETEEKILHLVNDNLKRKTIAAIRYTLTQSILIKYCLAMRSKKLLISALSCLKRNWVQAYKNEPASERSIKIDKGYQSESLLGVDFHSVSFVGNRSPTERKKGRKMGEGSKNLLMKVMYEWSEFARKSALQKYKIELMRKESSRSLKVNILKKMKEVLTKEKKMFDDWIESRNLKNAFEGFKNEVEIIRKRRSALRRLLLIKIFEMKKASFRLWSDYADQCIEDIDYTRRLHFLKTRIAFRRFMNSVQNKREITLGKESETRVTMNMARRVLTHWNEVSCSAQGTLLRMRLCIRHMVRSIQEKKRERAAQHYSEFIMLKKSLAGLQYNYRCKMQTKEGVSKLVILFISRRVTDFFTYISTQNPQK